jgi:hypothetical protein
MLITLFQPSRAANAQPAMPPGQAPMAEFWQQPSDIANQDLFYGPWGIERAPDPTAKYLFVDRKREGTNPGMTVEDQHGHQWHVKQPPHNDLGAEGPVEVTLSRVLSAVGYHQPPVYFLPSLSVTDDRGTHLEPGGRFRLTEKSIKHIGSWSWQRNPFVGTQPYRGLLVILLMFNSSDLKNENNALYEVRHGEEGVKRWYVVRDLGTALGETARLAPRRGNLELFERQPFINTVIDGVVRFNYHGGHDELLRGISPDDVAWASALLGELTGDQWRDAFRAGGFEPEVANRFIARLRQRIAEGRRLGETTSLPPATLPLRPVTVGARR